MANTGVSDVASTIQTVISELTTQTLIQESVALAMAGIWDRSGEVGPGMDTLDMILLSELAIQDVNEDGSAMTPQTITPVSAGLVLNQHKSVPFSITKRASLQSRIDLLARTVQNGLRSLAAQVDDYVFSECISNAGDTNVTAAADALEAIRLAAKYFDDQKVPKAMRTMVVSPGFLWDDLLATNNVIRANEFGSSDPIRVSSVGNIFGIEVFESSSSSLPDDGFLALGMEACAFARQRAVSFSEQEQVLGERYDYTVTHLYGAKSTVATTNPRIYVYDPA